MDHTSNKEEHEDETKEVLHEKGNIKNNTLNYQDLYKIDISVEKYLYFGLLCAIATKVCFLLSLGIFNLKLIR